MATPQQPQRNWGKIALVVGGGIAGVLVFLIVLGAVVGPRDDPEPAAAPGATAQTTAREAATQEATTQAPTTTAEAATTTQAPVTTTPATTTTTAPPAPRPRAVPEGCTPASESLVATVERGITEDGVSLADAFVSGGPDGETYFAANMFDESGRRVSSVDLWVVKDGVVYALSSDARDGDFPDGRRVFTSPASHEAREPATDCATQAIYLN